MQTTKTTPAGPAPTDRVWVGINGEARCDVHAGHSLSAAITARPAASHHRTDLDDWEAFSRAEAPCETCPAQP